MKKLTAVFMTAVLSALSFCNTLALTDARIFTDPVQNIYTGRREAAQMIKNIDFKDVAPDFWAKESIVRSGALNMVKGYGQNYSPNAPVSNQEALAFTLRAIGEEQSSQDAAVTVAANMPANSPLRTLWSVGYLNMAQQLGLITLAQYNDALMPDQAALDPTVSFARERAATREQVADWLVRGLETVNPDAFATNTTQQNLYAFSDWEKISVDFTASMEKALQARIFNGNADGTLNPKGSLTRAEMAQVLRNMDSIYYQMEGIQSKTGTVGGVKEAQASTTGEGYVARDIYVRNHSGAIDVLRYEKSQTPSPQSGDSDTVTHKDGAPVSLALLSEGDEIEYLVRDEDKTALYVNVVSSEVKPKTLRGVLKSASPVTGLITITSDTGKDYAYPMIAGLYGVEADDTPYVVVGGKKRSVKDIPVGSSVELSLKNDVVDIISYVGEANLVAESRAIIIENDPALGNLTYIDNRGNEITKYYYDNDITVKKRQFYDRDDRIGYISQMFPHFQFNPLDTTIDQIEPGDIAFLRFSPDDPDTITDVSASTNYITKYGKIKQFVNNGDYSSMVIEYENKQTSWFDVANDIFMSKDGKPINLSDVKTGDWTRLLINQAVLEPGSILESVKEMVIEGDGHLISTIVKGQLTGINAIQNQLQIQNAQKLSKTGWSDYKNVEQFSLAGKDIEVYLDGKRISLDYAAQALKRSDGDVYVALENNYSGEKVKKVTFRTGRDELISPDTVVSADGSGSFTVLSNDGAIQTDSGTIVRRHGRLVDGGSIMVPDYAVIALNGQNRAAVVDVLEAPDTSGVIIIRGRVDTIDDGKTFKVKSMAILSDNEWSYSPVEREFAIDYNTLFLDGSGVVRDSAFITYGEDSLADRVYNIVITGSHADRVVDAPYSVKSVRGTIYEFDGSTAKVKNASYYDNATGKWLPVSDINNTLVINLAPNTIIVKNNAVVTQSGLTAGDLITVMTDTLPAKVTPGLAVDAYVLQVEK